MRTTWSYDAAGQLTRERRNGANALGVTHVYDPAGNRTVLLDSGVRTTSSYDAANQLTLEKTGATRTTYAHDDCGNRTRKEAVAATTYYSWDARGKLSEAEPPSGAVTLTYNAVGKRVKKQRRGRPAGSSTTSTRCCRRPTATGPRARGTPRRRGSGATWSASSTAGATLYHEYELPGSTAALLNDAASETDRYVYRAFGLQTQTAGTTDNDYTFVGRKGYFRDSETDLYLLDARYYDPIASRFVSEDPSGYKGGDFNLYRYAFNNPVRHVDPSGKAILVRPEDTAAGGCAHWSGLRSGPTDKLRNQLFDIYGPFPGWQAREQLNFPLLTGIYPQEAPDDFYYALKLFDILPDEVWSDIETKISRRTHPADLRDRIQEGIQENRVIREEQDGSLSWRVPRQSGGFLSSLWSLIQTIGGAIFNAILNVVGTLLRGLLAFARVALGALAKIAGIDLSGLLSALEQFEDVLHKLITNGSDIVGRFVAGLEQGFNDFVDNAGEYVRTAIGEWLGLDVNLVNLDPGRGSGRLTDYVGVVLDLVRFNWNDVVGLVQEAVREAVGAENLAVVLGVFEKVSAALSQGVGAWLQGVVATGREFLADLGDRVSELWGAALETLKAKGKACAAGDHSAPGVVPVAGGGGVVPEEAVRGGDLGVEQPGSGGGPVRGGGAGVRGGGQRAGGDAGGDPGAGGAAGGGEGDPQRPGDAIRAGGHPEEAAGGGGGGARPGAAAGGGTLEGSGGAAAGGVRRAAQEAGAGGGAAAAGAQGGGDGPPGQGVGGGRRQGVDQGQPQGGAARDPGPGGDAGQGAGSGTGSAAPRRCCSGWSRRRRPCRAN